MHNYNDFKLSVHSKQKLIFVPTFDENKEHYTIIQKMLRLSDYNLFDNFENKCEKIVDYYGLKNLLPIRMYIVVMRIFLHLIYKKNLLIWFLLILFKMSLKQKWLRTF